MLNNILKSARIAGFALVAGLGLASTASATVIDFVIDRDNSSVNLVDSAGSITCFITNCGVEAVLASSLQTGDTYSISTGVTETFDFLTFTGSRTGLSNVSITATLAFLSPAGVTGTGTGSGSALLLAGNIINGVLNWSTVMLNGSLPSSMSVASFGLQGGSGLFLGNSETTTASITGVSIVPLPAGGLLLISAMGGLAALRRRNKSRAA